MVVMYSSVPQVPPSPAPPSPSPFSFWRILLLGVFLVVIVAVISTASGGDEGTTEPAFDDVRACQLIHDAVQTGSAGNVAEADRLLTRAFYVAEPGGDVEQAALDVREAASSGEGLEELATRMVAVCDAAGYEGGW